MLEEWVSSFCDSGLLKDNGWFTMKHVKKMRVLGTLEVVDRLVKTKKIRLYKKRKFKTILSAIIELF